MQGHRIVFCGFRNHTELEKTARAITEALYRAYPACIIVHVNQGAGVCVTNPWEIQLEPQGNIDDALRMYRIVVDALSLESK